MILSLTSRPTRLVGVSLLLALAPAAAGQTIDWCVTATGAEQVPPVNTAGVAYGRISLDLSNNQLTWDIAHKDLSGALSASHLHGPAVSGQNGGVQVSLGNGNPITGSAFLSAGQVADLMAGLWYVNLHTAMNPGGELRGQVDDACSATTWCVTATGNEEVPPTGSTALAAGTVTLDGSTNLLSWDISHTGLMGNHTGSHLHGPAPVGANAGVQVDLGVGNPLVGAAPITTTQALQLRCGLWYLNLHTSMFPGGEIRGQVDDLGAQAYCTALGNSFTPAGARLTTVGDFEVAVNALVLNATGVPPGNFGYVLIGTGTGETQPPGSAGKLCLVGAAIGRFSSQVRTADMGGLMGPFQPDLLSLPNPPGGSVSPGETWNFQAWFRDGMTNNFSDAIAVTFK